MMSTLLGFLLSRMPSRNPRTHRRVVGAYVVFEALLFTLVYGMDVICRGVTAPKSCLFSGLIFIYILFKPSCYDFCEQFVKK